MLLLKHLVRHHFPLQAPLDLITTAAGTSPAFMSSLGNPATAIGSSPPVIVVGAGLAGLAAASQLSGAHGVPVLLLEAAAKIGGNSIKASSGINGTPTRWQAAAFAKERAQRRERLQKEGEQAGKQSDAEAEGDKPDSVALFTNDTTVSAGHAYVHSTGLERTRRNRLIAALTSNSASAVDWLADVKGVDLSTVARSGGHARARTHRGAAGPPPGFAIVSALRRELEASPLVTVRLGARVTRVLREADEVVGVQYSVAGGGSSSGGGKDTSSTSAATAYGPVIFATGGFAGDAHGQLARHRPDLAGYPTTSDQRPGTGPLLVAAGARETDMALVQVHPTGFVDPARPRAVSKILAAEALRGEGGMLLVGRGRRFVDELRRRDEVTAAEYANADELRMGEQEQEQKEKGQEQESATRQWDVTLLIDEGVAAAMSTHLGFYTAKRLLRRTTVGALTAGTTADRHGFPLGPAGTTTTTTTTSSSSSSSSMPDLPATLRAYAAAATGTAPDPFGRTAFGHWALSEPHPDAVVYVGAVTPVVHFTMGGVEVDEWGRVLDGWSKRRPATEGDGAAGEDGDLAPIAGLWAAGEVTGGLHGANRLGGSSLLECVVFGRRVADAAAAFWRGHYHRD